MQDTTQTVLPLFRRGQWYHSLDGTIVRDGSPAGLSLAPAIMIREDARRFRCTAQDLPVPSRRERLDMLSKAVEIFCRGEAEYGDVRQSLGEFTDQLRTYQGLPHRLVNDWIKAFQDVFESQDWDSSPEASRGEIALVSLPSNTFLCLEACFGILVSGSALWLRPSQREPFSALRLITCLLQAGWPKELLAFYGTARDVLPAMVSVCDRAILFGGEELEAAYKDFGHVSLRGPGRTAVIVGEEGDSESAAAWLLEKVAGNAGRFCTNASIILLLHDFEAISKLLVDRLDSIPADGDDAPFPLVRQWDRTELDRMEAWVRERMQPEDAFLTRRPFIVRTGDGTWMPSPVLVGLENPVNHPLWGLELPFPFAVVVRVEEEDIPRLTQQSRFIFRWKETKT